MSKQNLSGIVLAAGKGTRMKSPLPKVLHPVAGRPMISYVIGALRGLDKAAEIRVVVGYGEQLLRKALEPLGVSCSLQSEQKGTGHAVQCAEPGSLGENVLILSLIHI